MENLDTTPLLIPMGGHPSPAKIYFPYFRHSARENWKNGKIFRKNQPPFLRGFGINSPRKKKEKEFIERENIKKL
jgi:hypothetical protein